MEEIPASGSDPNLQHRTLHRGSKRRDLAEILVGYALILAVIWTPRPWQEFLWWVALLVIACFIVLSFESFHAMGLRAGNFLRSLWVVAAALAFSAVAVSISAHLHTLRHTGGPIPLIEGFWSYAIWSGVQQFLLQCFFLSRLVRLLPNPRLAAFAAAGLFALAHVPNPVLAVLTVIWGTIACLVFLRYRNLYPLAIAHAVLGITIAVVVPGQVDHNMRVGLGYLRYHRGQRHPLLQSRQIDPTAAAINATVGD